MHLGHPIISLIPSLTGYVLEVMANTTRPLSGREVQRLVARPASQQGVQRVLDRLAGQGVVLQQETGSAILHTLNRDHLLAPIVAELAAVRTRIVPELGSMVSDRAPEVEAALLFGSAARGDGDETSDVDLLLVWPDGTDDTRRAEAEAAIAAQVRARLGNSCNPLSYTSSDYRELADRAPELWRQLQEASVDLLAIQPV